ncbi:MAG: hypothetical protein ACTSVG_13800 [Alphaproteobacteria bacterium]
MRSFATLLICIALATPAWAEIELTEPADTALAVAISDAVDATTERVGSCIGGGGAHQDCLCAGAAEIAAIRDALDAALAVHTEWEGQTLSVADKGDGQSLTLFLDTVAASSTPPDCG